MTSNTRMQVNMADFLGLPVFIIASAVALGLLDSTIMGFDLSTTLVDIGAEQGFSIANTAAIATLGYVAYTNDWQADEFDAAQIWVLLATVGLLIAPPFFAPLADTLAQTPAAMFALAVQAGGFLTFSYLG